MSGFYYFCGRLCIQMHETDDKTETIKIIKLCGKGFKPYILQSPLRC